MSADVPGEDTRTNCLDNAAPVVEAQPGIRQGVFVVQPVSVVDITVSDETSNVSQTESLASTPAENRMPSTPKPTRKVRKAAGDKSRSRAKHKATAYHGARGIAFRLSRDHVRMIDAKVQALNKRLNEPETNQSDVLRSLLVTHQLIDNPRIDGVLFIGDYRACKNKEGLWVVLHESKELEAYQAVRSPKGWHVADRNGMHVAVASGVTSKSMLRKMSEWEASKAARDVAFLRAEWLAHESDGSGETDASGPRKNDSMAFRLPTEERIALQRLATQNATTVSGVLRSFLTTQLSQHKDRLHEVTIGPCRLYTCPEGWAIRKRKSLLQTVKTLEQAVGGALWEAGNAA
jgi:hypothetical protein